ncbi:hypothetical protein [Nocardiopsis halotolerans]|uniref:hypothetical protein n=1 Tax=Nocardiopsis halotolerans TaxID=124252 RepID=UPI00373AF1CF
MFDELFSSAAHGFWLDSGEKDRGRSRSSLMGDDSGPWAEWVTYGVDDGIVTTRRNGSAPSHTERPFFDHLGEQLEKRTSVVPEGLPLDFNLGYVGYLGYEPQGRDRRRPRAQRTHSGRRSAVRRPCAGDRPSGIGDLRPVPRRGRRRPGRPHVGRRRRRAPPPAREESGLLPRSHVRAASGAALASGRPCRRGAWPDAVAGGLAATAPPGCPGPGA